MQPDPGFTCWVEPVVCNNTPMGFTICTYKELATAPRWLMLPELASKLRIKPTTLRDAVKRGRGNVSVGEETDTIRLRQLKALGGLGPSAPRVSMVTVGGLRWLLAALGSSWVGCITMAEALRLSRAVPQQQLRGLRRQGASPATLPAPRLGAPTGQPGEEAPEGWGEQPGVEAAAGWSGQPEDEAAPGWDGQPRDEPAAGLDGQLEEDAAAGWDGGSGGGGGWGDAGNEEEEADVEFDLDLNMPAFQRCAQRPWGIRLDSLTAAGLQACTLRRDLVITPRPDAVPRALLLAAGLRR